MTPSTFAMNVNAKPEPSAPSSISILPPPTARRCCFRSAFLARFAFCLRLRLLRGLFAAKPLAEELSNSGRGVFDFLARLLGGGSERPFAAVEGVAMVVGGEVADGIGEGERDRFRGIRGAKSSDSISTLR